MTRTDGKKLVAVASLGIVAVVGFAQIYLPFIADRDKLRGLFEEEDMPTGARRELDAMMRAERLQAMKEAREQAQQSGNPETNANDKRAPGSMWKNLGGSGK
mmetsp:Transcript_29310/g.39104  ORF Transcript_29310/g.39104 Transcript_29310/m.39104 type:complete len:102 (-) Transcript_29310:1415-1720(-)|eukprot:107173-Ditylum_brightwellii.AAC.1